MYQFPASFIIWKNPHWQNILEFPISSLRRNNRNITFIKLSFLNELTYRDKLETILTIFFSKFFYLLNLNEMEVDFLWEWDRQLKNDFSPATLKMESTFDNRVLVFIVWLTAVISHNQTNWWSTWSIQCSVAVGWLVSNLFHLLFSDFWTLFVPLLLRN